MRTTIHITSKDRPVELTLLLSSLLRQTNKDFDLMILDDSSQVSYLENYQFLHAFINRLKSEGHGVKILRQNPSYGVCKARQLLVDEDLWKENPYILRLDDDQFLEPDYLERLVKVIESDETIGLVSGVTPLLSGPDFERNTVLVKPIVNEIKLDEQGNIVKYSDDCGTLYILENVLPAHQFRSSALMRRKIFDKIKYELGLTNTGFREEAFLSLRSLLDGYKIKVDLGAIAWHNPCPTGGCRAQDYGQRVMMDDNSFRDWVKTNKDKLKEVLK